MPKESPSRKENFRDGRGFADHGVSVGSGAILEQTGEPLEGPEHRVGIM